MTVLVLFGVLILLIAPALAALRVWQLGILIGAAWAFLELAQREREKQVRAEIYEETYDFVGEIFEMSFQDGVDTALGIARGDRPTIEKRAIDIEMDQLNQEWIDEDEDKTR